MAKGWVGTISPPGVLAYQEEESRGVWQTGNAVFMRNWPYAYSLGNGADSAVKGKFDVATASEGLRRKAPARRRRSAAGTSPCRSTRRIPKEAIELVKWIASPEMQKYRALKSSNLPTIQALYDDADIAKEQPIIPRWKEVFLNAVPRPSAPAKVKYNEVSSQFWTAVHKTLSGEGAAADNLADLEVGLTKLKGASW